MNAQGNVLGSSETKDEGPEKCEPVHNLGKGFYDIRVIIQGVLVWNQRFVK